MFVKICGITSEDDALLAAALGANAVGFVFAPSPRQVAAQTAADIAKRLPHKVMPVGVFRDEAPQRVLTVAHKAGMQAVQLHGREAPEECRWLRERIPMVIRAFTAGDPRARRAADYGADVVMLDAPSPGSGQVFDWELASEVPTGQRLMIAGGLHAGNVATVIARLRPWGVDVCTGVEAKPGCKDPIKLKNFMAAARAAEDALATDDALALADPAADGPEVYDWQDER